MKSLTTILLLLLTFTACRSQTDSEDRRQTSGKKVGGPCEGCEAIYEYGDRVLTSVDTLPGFEENEPKLKLTGIVYKEDGETPASDVILYFYHTNREGVYPTRGDEKGWAARHGYIRGWIKTDQEGKYTIYTFRPAPYPGRTDPEHIHVTVKEPDINEYYIDSFVFADDPILTKEEREHLENRGGSGISTPAPQNGLWLVERDIFLGRNIPDYE